MAKQRKITAPPKKKRGRPFAGGRDPGINLRCPPELRKDIEEWAKRQADKPSLSEAIRRLLEMQMKRSGGDG